MCDHVAQPIVARQNRCGADRRLVRLRYFLLREQSLSSLDRFLGAVLTFRTHRQPHTRCEYGNHKDCDCNFDLECGGHATAFRACDRYRFAADLTELFVHLARVRKSRARVFRQRLRDDRFELGRCVGSDLVQRARRFREDRRDDFVRGGPFERAAAGDHLIQNDAQAEDVCGRRDIAAADLLRRHVAKSAHGHTGSRLQQSGRVFAADLTELGQPEVEHFGVAIGSDDHILRFDVAVDDAGLVRRGES